MEYGILKIILVERGIRLGKKGSIKKDLIIFACIILVAIIVLSFKVYNDIYDRYSIGDYGISIRVPASFLVDKTDDGNLLSLYTENNSVIIKARDLRGDYWSSDDMDVIIDEYVKLISAMEYDSNIIDVELEKRKVGFKEIGIVKLSSDSLAKVNRDVAVLTHKANGYIVIEFMGDANVMKENDKVIERMINSIKFSQNKHDYSKDDSKGVLDVYRDVNGNEVTFDSGDDIIDKLEKIFNREIESGSILKSGE